MMDELNIFLQTINEGKKKKIEDSPGLKILQQLKKEISNTNPFNGISAGKQKVDIEPDLNESIQQSAEILTEIITPEVKPASKVYSMGEIEKYLHQNATFQQPNPDLVDPTIRAIQDKLKFLEQSVGKIAATGPGSGEVNFRYLDDVNRSTMTPINDNWLLEYDAATKKAQFTNQVGPLDLIKLNTTGPLGEVVPGTISWNPNEDCLDIAHADGSILQTGLEQYIRVYNNGSQILTQGTVVGFDGIIHNNDEVPIAVPYTAHSTALPLYIMGVLTRDVPPGEIGRCTTFGKVRGLDTTGDSGLGETWNDGDILWSHPTVAGRLTKYQPTSPYPAISIAAILRSHATRGVLLVRPTIFPRLWFGRFRDFTNQYADLINTPYAVQFGQTAAASGLHIDPNYNSRIVADFTGLYKFDIRLQFTSSNSSVSKIWVWYRLDGIDAVGTGTQYTIQSNGGIVVATLPYIISLQKDHYFELMWAVNNTNVSLLSPVATSFAPSTPCAVIAATQANL